MSLFLIVKRIFSHREEKILSSRGESFLFARRMGIDGLSGFDGLLALGFWLLAFWGNIGNISMLGVLGFCPFCPLDPLTPLE